MVWPLLCFPVLSIRSLPAEPGVQRAEGTEGSSHVSLPAVPPSRGVDTHTSRNAMQRPQISSFGHWAFMSTAHKHPSTQPMDPENITDSSTSSWQSSMLGCAVETH